MKTDNVVVIGEALVDVVEGSAGNSEHPGGSPLNVAIGLGRLGVPVSLATSIGDDDRGADITRRLIAAGVDMLPGSVTRTSTSTATARLDESGAASYSFDIHWSLSSHLAIPRARLLHTGSIAAFLEPGATRVAAALVAARGQSIVTFDPNIRPSLLGDPRETRMAFERLVRSCDVVKLSDEDAEWLYPNRSFDAVLDGILALGPSLAVMTCGAAGSVLSTSTGRVRIEGVPVQVVDTIGAGDSFMSALIYKVLNPALDPASPGPLWKGSALTAFDLESIGNFAASCAAVTVSRAGAEPPYLYDVGRAVPQC